MGIVGAGPAGMLSHLLSQSGIDSIAVDTRTRYEIEHTHRAGVLEQDSVRLLTDTGVDGRVLTHGSEHEGIELRFGARPPDRLQALVGASVWLYPRPTSSSTWPTRESVTAGTSASKCATRGSVRSGTSR